MYWSPKHWKSKQEFFESTLCFYFFVTLVQIQWPSQDINQVSLPNSFFKILIYMYYNLLLPSKWIVDDTCIPSPSICVFPYSRLFASSSRQLKLSLTRTFFDFPWRFELAGVNWILFIYYKWIEKVNCNYFTL